MNNSFEPVLIISKYVCREMFPDMHVSCFSISLVLPLGKIFFFEYSKFICNDTSIYGKKCMVNKLYLFDISCKW